MTVQITMADVTEDIRKIGRRAVRNWPGIDADDAAQAVALYLAQNWEYILAQAESDEQVTKWVYSLGKREAESYCARERYTYQAHTTEWVYTPREVRQLLSEHFFSRDSWHDAPKRPEWGNQTLLGDGAFIALMDIEKAFNALPETDQAIVIRAYDVHESLDGPARGTLSRAVDKITHALNRNVAETFDHSDHDGPGSRKVISNSQARAATHDNY